MATSSAPTPESIGLSRVRRLFSRPDRVAQSAFLRREVAARMFEKLELVRLAPAAVLDAGCGEGDDLAVLHQRHPQARLIGIDGAPAMLAAARAKHRSAQSTMNRLFSRLLPGMRATGADEALLVCADFARLPLARTSVDMVWSNLALHWHPDPEACLREWLSVLRNEGLLSFSCFGPDTFRELRSAAVAGVPASLNFIDMHDLGDMMVHAGFATPVMDMERLTLTYDSCESLLADVRSLGGNPLEARAGLAGKGIWREVERRLESQRGEDGKLRLTIELVFGHAFKPVPRTTAAGEAIIQFMPRK